MESKAKVLGHPVHPMLVTVPIGMFVASSLFDALSARSRKPHWGQVSYWMLATGLIGGAAAAAFGAADFLAIPRGTRAKRVGLAHGLGNAAVMALMAASLADRRRRPERPSPRARRLGLWGNALALVTGWLGGELVDRLGVGVDDHAHLDAPSSLSWRPALADWTARGQKALAR